MTLLQSFGWIGLGAMGYPMAMNLRKRIPADSILLVNDVDRSAVERFIRESSEFGRVVEAATARDITEQTVRTQINASYRPCLTMSSSRVCSLWCRKVGLTAYDTPSD